MKKIIIILLVSFLLISCKKKQPIESNNECPAAVEILDDVLGTWVLIGINRDEDLVVLKGLETTIDQGCMLLEVVYDYNCKTDI